MKKNFDNWNERKKNLEKNIRPRFKNGDVYFVLVGENIGDEESGKGNYFLRPVLILKKWNENFFCGIPLTSQKKENKFHSYIGAFGGVDSYGILSQIKQFDAKRLYRKIGSISFQKRTDIIKATFSLLGK